MSDEFDHLWQGGAQPAIAQAATPGDPDEFSALWKGGRQQGPQVGAVEAALRAAADTGTFGLANEFLDRERLAAGRHQHPIASFAGDALAVGAQTLALGPIAEAGHAVNAGRVARGAGRVAEAYLPNLEARTLTGVAATSAKAGGMQGLTHGVGDTVLDPDKSWGEVAGNAVFEGGVGTVAGGVLGPAVHAGAQVLNQAASRALPGLSEIRAVANSPESQGLKDIQRAMDYDGITPEALRARLMPQGAGGLTPEQAMRVVEEVNAGRTPAQAAAMFGVQEPHIHEILTQEAELQARFRGLNIVEAMQRGDLRPPPAPPALDPGRLPADTARVVADRIHGIPNDRGFENGASPAQIAQRMRNQGVTRPDADAIAQQGPALDAIAAENRGLPGDARNTAAMTPEPLTARNSGKLMQWAANQEGQGADAAQQAFATRRDMQPSAVTEAVDQAFGSGNKRAADDALENARRAVGQRYAQLRNQGIFFMSNALYGMDEHPLIRQGIDYALMQEFSRDVAAGAANISMQGVRQFEPNGNTVLTAENLLDIHHFVSRVANAPMADPAMAVTAQAVKRRFSQLADNMMAPHQDLRRDYSHAMTLIEATEQAKRIPIRGARNEEAMTFMEDGVRALRTAEAAVRREQVAYRYAQQRHAQGARVTPASRAALNQAEELVARATERVDTFRRSWAEAVINELLSKTDGNMPSVIRNLVTPEAKNRILYMLGRERGVAFIDALYTFDMQNKLGNKLYGGPDTAYKTALNQKMDATGRAVMAAMQGRPMALIDALGDIASGAWQRQRADRVNSVMAQQGLDNVRTLTNVLGARQQMRTITDPIFRDRVLPVAPQLGARETREDLRQ